MSNDPLEGLQALDPIRVDMQKRDKELSFTPLERNLVVDAIRFNQPLSGLLEKAAGAVPTSSGSPATTCPSAGRSSSATRTAWAEPPSRNARSCAAC